MLKEKIFVLLIYLISVISSQTIEIEKDKLKFKEAIRNLREMYQTIDRDHIDEVTKKVLKLEWDESKRKKVKEDEL